MQLLKFESPLENIPPLMKKPNYQNQQTDAKATDNSICITNKKGENWRNTKNSLICLCPYVMKIRGSAAFWAQPTTECRQGQKFS